MTSEAFAEGDIQQLFNPDYVTELGVKEIEIDDEWVLVHETSNLRFLFDAYFHQQEQKEPANFLEKVTFTKLDDPEIVFILDGFCHFYPQQAELLKTQTLLHDLEYERRAELRERIEEEISLSPRLLAPRPSEIEEARRDLIYSQTLDAIGDILSRYGIDYDLNKLCQ